jgi:hypothetical protein
MKRGIILFLLVLLFIPAVSASINIIGPTNAHPNIGDELDITGEISQEEDFSGFFQLTLLCGEEIYPLPATAVDLIGENPVELSQLALPQIRVTSGMVGLCQIRGQLFAAEIQIDEFTTTSFEVSRDLKGTFNSDRTQVQKGETIRFTGMDIEQLDGDKVTGTAELYIEKEGLEYLIGFLDVIEGEFTYDYQFILGEPGDYGLNLIVRDIYGNEQEFSETVKFEVLSDLQLFVQLSTTQILPGEHVNVFGDVKTLTNKFVESGSIEIILNGKVHSTALEDSQYTYDLWTDFQITSGEHIIEVKVTDSSGNVGTAKVPIQITPKATSIGLDISAEELKPNEEFQIDSFLYDQTGELMSGDLYFELYDPKGKVISEKTVFSSEKLAYQLDQTATPGEWIVKLSYDESDFVEEKRFTVTQVSELDYYIEGEKLYISNIGNIRYLDDIEIAVNSGDSEYVIKRTKNLDVGESFTIDLSDELPTGTYSVSIPTGFAVGELGDVSVADGKNRKSLGWLYTIIALLFIGGLGYIIYFRFRPKKKDDKKKIFKEKKPLKIKKRKEVKEAAKKKKPSYKFDSKKDSLKDFKERTLVEIEKTQNKMKKDKDRNKFNSGKLGYVTGKSDQKPIRPVKNKTSTAQMNPSAFNIFD